MWTFRCYTSSRRKNEIHEWYEGLDSKCRTKVFTRIRHLGFQPKSNWKDYAHHLTNSDDIYSIIVPHKGNQYRITGFFKDDTNEFILLFVFIEKDTKKDYKVAIERANKLKKEVLNGAATTIEYNFLPTE
jgi:hypothetical protein